jgi:phosphoribosylformylglycinamidine cyclo-ligase
VRLRIFCSPLLEGYRDFANIMSDLGVSILLAGGETADAGDTVRTLVVDSTMYVRMLRKDVIDFSRVAPGDVIIGFSSTGCATYESDDNSGIGSNGFTLARHALLSNDYARQFPETYAPELDAHSVYRGKFLVSDTLPGMTMTVAQALLSPTRTYAPIVRNLLASNYERIHGLIHNTGGGLTKCLRFGNGLSFVKTELFPLPAIFCAIQEAGGVDTRTMLQTFNCGHRLELFCEPKHADSIIATANAFGVAAQIIGEVYRSHSGKNEVEINIGASTYHFD